MGLFTDLGEEEEGVEELVRVRTADEEDGAMTRDIECASGSEGRVL